MITEVCKSFEYESLKNEFSTSIAAIAAASNKIPAADFNWKNLLIICMGIFCLKFVMISDTYNSVKF